jgi:hypothetical protein
MEMSECVNEIAAALAKAQAAFGKLVATNEVKVETKRGHDYTYTYANLAQALDACRATLNKEDIAVVQLPERSDRNGIEVSTMLVHSSGQWIRSAPLFMPVQGGAQDVGSAITYGRRYQLLAMVGLAPEDDDDGAGAQGAKPNDWGESKRGSGPKRDAVGPRCRGGSWLGDLGRENEKLMRDISDAEEMTMGDVWDKLLEAARVDLGPYHQADGRLPQSTADLGKADGQRLKKVAQAWLREIASNG